MTSPHTDVMMWMDCFEREWFARRGFQADPWMGRWRRVVQTAYHCSETKYQGWPFRIGHEKMQRKAMRLGEKLEKAEAELAEARKEVARLQGLLRAATEQAEQASLNNGISESARRGGAKSASGARSSSVPPGDPSPGLVRRMDGCGGCGRLSNCSSVWQVAAPPQTIEAPRGAS
eukprot:gnl/TRDRNA2_/TRDRNA2_155389_c0_seq2.p1 gnl/TRDRNA2_/TRDRNA2_155389_c0~~gnl/TRDRNA2_/TRDRNA2_155389_c0_seq2.p1  ORF type:complete len:175 (-),score=27.89 gnl/TRDRNA2_/TRDRNA2_155389_c0_seq2:82-606(-)